MDLLVLWKRKSKYQYECIYLYNCVTFNILWKAHLYALCCLTHQKRRHSTGKEILACAVLLHTSLYQQRHIRMCLCCLTLHRRYCKSKDMPACAVLLDVKHLPICLCLSLGWCMDYKRSRRQLRIFFFNKTLK